MTQMILFDCLCSFLLFNKAKQYDCIVVRQRIFHYNNRMNADSQRNQRAQLLQAQPANRDSNRNSQHPITPYNVRTKTDVCWIVLYMALTTVLVVAFYSSFILEKDRNLLKPEDPNGRKCGYDDAKQYPYIYFPTPFASDLNRAVCVKDCPTSSESIVQCLPNSAIKSCEFTMTDQMNRTNQFIVYPTSRNNFIWLCQPSSKILFDAVNQKINTHHLFMNLERVYQSRYVILVVCPAISIIIVLVYVFILTIIRDFIFLFKSFIASFAIILFALAIYCFTPSAKRFFGYMPQIGIVVLIIAILFTAYMIYNRDHVTRCLKLIQIGVQYIRQNRSLVFISVIFFLLWIIVFALQLIALIYIYSMDTLNQHSQEYQFAYMAGIQNTWFVKMLLIISVIHYFWTNFILYSIGEYICMAAGTFWILEIKNNFKNALFTLFRFHIGTVIFGSITNVILGKFTQFLYLFMPKQNNRLLCCLCPKLSQFYKGSCFQNYLGVFNELNYIRVAMKGQNLITAGRQLSKNLVQNLNYVSRAYKLARLVVFISKMLAAFTTTFICYLVIAFSPSLQSSLITNIIIFLLSLLLIGFAFQSYDRSFQVILITILIKHKTHHQVYDQNNFKIVNQWVAAIEGQGEHLEYSALEKRRNLEKVVLKWFQDQKVSERDSNNIQEYN